MYKFVCVLDFEATCEKDVPEFENEIIEFPSVLLQYTGENTLVEISRFQQYVSPKKNQRLTKFCTELTGITQEMVENGKNFKETLKLYEEWLAYEMQDTPSVENVLFVTCGDWDLRKMIALQCNLSNVEIPQFFNKWCNLKILMSKFESKEMKGMTEMLKHYNLELKGRHHSGIDDCANIAQVVIVLFSKGCYICPTTERIGKKVNSYKLDFTTKNYEPSKISTNKKKIISPEVVNETKPSSKIVQFHSFDKTCELIPFSGKNVKDLYATVERVCKTSVIKIKKVVLYHHDKLIDSDSQVSQLPNEAVLYQDNTIAHTLYKQTKQFMDSEKETFEFPKLLENIERRFIHSLCEDFGIYSQSEGRDNNKPKKLVISKVPFKKTKNDNIPSGISTIFYDFLYLGSGKDALDNEQLIGFEIQHILNLTEEWRKPHLKTVDFKRVPLKDQENVDILKHFDEVFKYLDKIRDQGRKVLVHCVIGKSRSASFVVGYVMKEKKMKLDDALRYVKSKRSLIKPNDGFMKQLLEWEKKLELE